MKKTMELTPLMKQIFSTFFVFRDNTHQLHVKCKGTGAIYFHPFLGDIYEWADSKIDRLMEHAEFLKIELPKQYTEIQINSKIAQYEAIETDINKQKDLLKEAMDYLFMFIGVREDACIETDTPLNTNLIDYKKELSTFIYKNNSELGI